LREPITSISPDQPRQPARAAGRAHSPRERLAVALIVFGFFIFVIGVFPGLIRLDLTPGIGLLQITVFLLGLSVMTLGAYIYVAATRPEAGPHRLSESIGVRLMATGLVLCYAAGYADLLGIGTNEPGDEILLGQVQAIGVALGVFVIVAGLAIYARRRRD
jgi:hypothetical protein